MAPCTFTDSFIVAGRVLIYDWNSNCLANAVFSLKIYVLA